MPLSCLLLLLFPLSQGRGKLQSCSFPLHLGSTGAGLSGDSSSGHKQGDLPPTEPALRRLGRLGELTLLLAITSAAGFPAESNPYAAALEQTWAALKVLSAWIVLQQQQAGEVPLSTERGKRGTILVYFGNFKIVPRTSHDAVQSKKLRGRSFSHVPLLPPPRSASVSNNTYPGRC